MKPMIVIPPDLMDKESIELLRENNICVVIAKDQQAVRFLDPIPSVAARSVTENAAIQLSRRLLRGDLFRDNRRDFANLYVDCLIKGTPLDSDPTQEEKERQIFDTAKADEIRRLAREEAKAERMAAKQKQ